MKCVALYLLVVDIFLRIKAEQEFEIEKNNIVLEERKKVQNTYSSVPFLAHWHSISF